MQRSMVSCKFIDGVAYEIKFVPEKPQKRVVTMDILPLPDKKNDMITRTMMMKTPCLIRMKTPSIKFKKGEGEGATQQHNKEAHR